MNKYRYTVALTLQGPVLTHSSDTLNFGYDMAMRKYQKRPVLNGSLIRGNILHSFKYFAEKIADEEDSDKKITENDICTWFGMASKNQMEAERSMLNFDYFWVLQNASEGHSNTTENATEGTYRPRYRIGISDETGVVEPGNVQVIESAFAAGEEPVFSGCLSLWAENDEQADRFERWLKKSLQYISAMGALKGVGFGKLVASTVNVLKEEPVSGQRAKNNIKSIEYEFTLDRPLCVAGPHMPNSNKFVSEAYITGAVLKGAFARLLEKSGAETGQSIQNVLSDITFSHALPAQRKSSARPLPLPLSLALADQQLIDMALQTQCCLLYKNNKYIAPEFSPDWKPADFKKVAARLAEKDICFNVPQRTQRLLSVRTMIKAQTKAADDGKLFSLECIDNHYTDEEKRSEKTLWRARIDFAKLKDQKAGIQQQICQQLSRYALEDIGKTKARAHIACTTGEHGYARDESDLNPVKIDGKNAYIVLLRTDARLLPSDHTIQPSNDQQSLHEQYRQYFEHVSGRALILSHYYAQQSLYGGEFYRSRYRQENTYAPEWLTLAGSVFVLTEADGSSNKAINTVLESWLKSGLPVAEDRENDTWQTDPFNPQNGYGEIVINHSVHSVLARPEQGELKTEYEIAGGEGK